MAKKTLRKKTTYGADLIEGMNLVLAHQRGKLEVEQVWPKPIDVKAIRKRVKMSQAEFSRTYGISKRALQEWEQGGRQPDSAARAYLTVIAKEPAAGRWGIPENRRSHRSTSDKIVIGAFPSSRLFTNRNRNCLFSRARPISTRIDSRASGFSS